MILFLNVILENDSYPPEGLYPLTQIDIATNDMKAYISDIVLNVHLYFVQIHFEGKLGYFGGKLGISGES